MLSTDFGSFEKGSSAHSDRICSALTNISIVSGQQNIEKFGSILGSGVFNSDGRR